MRDGRALLPSAHMRQLRKILENLEVMSSQKAFGHPLRHCGEYLSLMVRFSYNVQN